MKDVKIEIYTDYPENGRMVREEVFIEEQGFSYDYDEIDDVAVHFVLFQNGVAVGACRLFSGEEDGTFILGRLAVKKEYRKNNYGSMLIQSAKDYVKSVNGKKICLHSQLQAKGFYLKNGFEEYGDVEYEEDCPHIWMKTKV